MAEMTTERKADESKDTYIFGLVPGFNGAEVVLRTRGELEAELESKQAIDMLHEVKEGTNLVFQL